jgi:cold shock protein
MATGTVKWFNNAKGYGFIRPDNGGDDIFAHYSTIEMEGYKSLKAGQEVSFDTCEGPKGLHALDISPVSTDALSKNQNE